MGTAFQPVSCLVHPPTRILPAYLTILTACISEPLQSSLNISARICTARHVPNFHLVIRLPLSTDLSLTLPFTSSSRRSFSPEEPPCASPSPSMTSNELKTTT